jgi:hypothetical protein
MDRHLRAAVSDVIRHRHLIVGAVAMLGIWMASGTPLLACPVCFRVEDGAVADGVRAGVLVLAGITVGVLALVGVWWTRFVRRSDE